jgi:antitoxin (DNA-binding transcriptional repressor) of toxin-antitoxin stability system
LIRRRTWQRQKVTRASLTRGTGAARKILFDKAANCDNQNIMKVASVADLRNNFASVSRWIYEGESVAIQKRGKAFAVLAPAEKKRKKPVEWPDYEARLHRIYGGRTPTGATAAELVDYMRGEY